MLLPGTVFKVAAILKISNSHISAVGHLGIVEKVLCERVYIRLVKIKENVSSSN